MSTGDGGADLTGRVLGGRYRVTRQLGRGGMGVVCAAMDEVLGREVAVKVLRAFTDAGPEELADLRTRMRREARAAARIRHSGVITVHDVADENGLPVIVMELIDGPSLDDVLAAEGVLTPVRAAAIGARVAEALGAGHEVGVLHRDVKPGNVLIDRAGATGALGSSAGLGGGRVVLTDFGIASMDTPDDGAATKLTRSGELIGSLDYLAPERAQGHEPGPASDVWALGMTLYAAVEGSSPFRRTSVWSTLTAIVTEPLPAPHRAGPLTAVLWALMAKDPAARPTAAQAARLLDAVAAGQAVTFASGASGAAPYEALGGPTQGPFGGQGQGQGQGHGSGGGGRGYRSGGAGEGFGGGAAVGAAGQVGPFGAAGAYDASGVAGTFDAPATPDVAGIPGVAATSGVAGIPGADMGPVGVGAADGDGRGAGSAKSADGAAGGAGSAGDTWVADGRRPTRRLPAPRRKRRTTLVAVAAATVLVGGGVAYALTEQGGDDTPRAGGGASGRPDGATAPGGGPADQGRGGGKGEQRPAGASSPAQTGSAGGEPDSRRDGESRTDDQDSKDGKGSKGSKGGGSGGEDGKQDGRQGDAGKRDDAGKTKPEHGTSPSQSSAPVCHPSGAGPSKHDCTVWKSATSYSRDGSQVGTLNSGVNYFFCQENLGRRESSGAWTNVWWAKTDDDSGNAGVYVSVVYLKGGANDQPAPGLPVC
ncbi:serine/threonine protein kinase [Streptomyces zagrosensis]|uniref:non-specific serine/threonine protein kinase n=1 Tax=Streptomyces zagrosensis TaxID=1042984 RepID=A0A7W9Q925_9ACTN|nr:serine/threonine protein kinase [Streptomyces zagrosensis]MBB5935398.1 tRNA A-37 threonylcarbamoyl transferase component Bud32 [Streptomyces zagrosensis]